MIPRGGTPGCLSPESFNADREVTTDEISGKSSDYWGLGVVMYFLAAGRFPFESTSIQGNMRPFEDSYSSSLHKLIERMLHRNERLRPSSTEIINNFEWLKIGMNDTRVTHEVRRLRHNQV